MKIKLLSAIILASFLSVMNADDHRPTTFAMEALPVSYTHLTLPTPPYV